MSASIQIHNLRKSYGNAEALRGIDLCVEQGEIFAILGPNGAGKSTLISIISTLVLHEQGEVRIQGYLLGKQNEAIRQCLGVVFQGSMLDAPLTVKQNLMLRCGLYGLYGAFARQRVEELASSCQLSAFLHQRVQTLSGGQRRRVDIARALIPHPKLLILDEPSTGLDPKSRKELWEMIQELHQKDQITILLTTHYMEEAEIADHICMMQHGKVLVDGKREVLKQRFQKEQLSLYTHARGQVSKALDQKRISYHWQSDHVDIELTNFYQLMSILRGTEHYVHRIEIKTGSIEDMYLQVLEEETL